MPFKMLLKGIAGLPPERLRLKGSKSGSAFSHKLSGSSVKSYDCFI